MNSNYVFLGCFFQYKSVDIAMLQRSILNEVRDKPDFLPMLYELTNVIACGMLLIKFNNLKNIK